MAKDDIVYSEDSMPEAMSQIVVREEFYARDTLLHLGDTVLCLGEITNMPGHIAFVDVNGVMHWGYHPDNFREYDEERD